MATTLPHARDPLDTADADVAPPATGPAEICVSCGAARSGRFCAQCGEKRVEPGDYTLRHVLGELAEQFLSLDGRLLRTMRALATRPGMLTAEYIAGRRRPYSRPLSLFVLLNVIFFLASPYLPLLRYTFGAYEGAPPIGVPAASRMIQAKIGAEPPSGAPAAAVQAYERRKAAYATAFNSAAEGHKRSLLIFLVPAFALLVAVVQWRRHRTFVEHLVFSVHSVTWMLLFLLVAVPLLAVPLWTFLVRPAYLAIVPRASEAAVHDVFEALLALFIMVGFATALTIALRRVYADRRLAAVAKAIALSFSFMLLFQVYRSILFVMTYYLLP